MTLRIGTSGFDYKHWQGRFYPRELPSNERLAFYARHFDTVELNVTFYRMPAADAFRRWATIADEADANAGAAKGVTPREPFVFAVKASRYLTHVRRLLQPADAVAFLMDRARLLGRHLGPILLQLPPDMEIELERLDATLAAFGDDVRVAVEPRHDSWFVPELEALLQAHGAALCLVDRHGPRTPLWQTADWTYVRFHAGGALPPGCYRDDELAAWAGRLEASGGRPSGRPRRVRLLQQRRIRLRDRERRDVPEDARARRGHQARTVGRRRRDLRRRPVSRR